MKKRVLFVLMTVLAVMVGFISCNSSIEDRDLAAYVSFAPSVSKALNQSGAVTNLSQNLNDYHWKYFVSTKTANPTDTDWQDFTDAEVGLGTIKDLFKGDSYYFGLRGYTSNTSYTDDDLIWEGFHFNETKTAPEAVTLNTKRQVITIDVYSKGKGSLYFNITAPNVVPSNINQETKTLVAGCKADIFEYSYERLGGTETAKNKVLNSVYNSATDSFDYEDPAGTPIEQLTAGTYVFTVCQKAWNLDSKSYDTISERSQIIIVNIVAGVDTVIAGSLDSSALVSFDYEAYGYTDKIQKGIHVIYHQEDGSAESPLVTTVTMGADNVVTVLPRNIATLEDGQFITITWDENLTFTDLFINGDSIVRDGDDLVSDTDGYLVRYDGSELETSVSKVKFGADGHSVVAYADKFNDYLLTITAAGKSVSYTVKTGENFVKVTFIPDNGNANTIEYVNSGSYISKIADPSKDGKYFTGWFSSGTEWNFTSDTVVTNTDLTAQWIDLFTVTFKDGDSVLFTQDVPVGYSVKVPAVPTKDHSLFVSWTDTTGTDWDFANNKITTDTEIQSVWLEAVKISFEDEDGIELADSKLIVKGTKLTTPTVIDFENDKHVSVWKNKATGSVWNFDTVVNEDLVLVASQWGINGFMMMSGTVPFTLAYERVANGYGYLEYSYDTISWTTWLNGYTFYDSTDPAVVSSALEGDSHIIYLRGTGIIGFVGGTCKLSMTDAPVGVKKEIKCYGDIMNILDYKEIVAGDEPTMEGNAFHSFFKNWTYLTKAPKLSAKNLSGNCYEAMFLNTGITEMPELPATTLADDCYLSMFKDCSKLTVVHPLPATALVNNCYYAMFKGCTALIESPEIMATKVKKDNWHTMTEMFMNCSNLKKITVHYEGSWPSSHSVDWVDGVSSSGTFYCPQNLTISPNQLFVPKNWRIVRF